MNNNPKINEEFLTVYENDIDVRHWINLIESVNQNSYMLERVPRRPHLTMELPSVYGSKDSHEAIELRAMFYNILNDSLIDFLKRKNLKNMAQHKTYITVSKLSVLAPMKAHVDLPDDSLLIDSFISMFYVNDDFGGGELFFPTFDYKYKPKAGDIAYYKMKDAHGVAPVTEGKRYTVGYGFVGPVKD
jgi:ribosomal protein S24E